MPARRFVPVIRSWTSSVLDRARYRGGSRDLRLDLLRGFAVFAMVADHVGGDHSYLYSVTGGNVFFVSAAEAFVFISGMVMGVVYSKAVWRDGIGAGVRMALKRAWKLYWLTVLLTLLYSAFSYRLGLPWADTVDPQDLETFVVGVLTLHRTYFLTDVLLMYTLLVLAAPAVLALVAKRQTLIVLLASWALWAAWQRWPEQVQVPWAVQDNLVFHFPAWQALFVTGIVVGCHREALGRWLSRVPALLLLTSSAGLGTGTLWFYRHEFELFGRLFPLRDPTALDAQLFSKSDLRVGRLFVFLILCTFAFTLLSLQWQPIKHALGWLLLPLGQHALTAYTVHLFIVGLVVRELPGLSYSGEPVLLTTVIQLATVLLVWAVVMFLGSISKARLAFGSPGAHRPKAAARSGACASIRSAAAAESIPRERSSGFRHHLFPVPVGLTPRASQWG